MIMLCGGSDVGLLGRPTSVMREQPGWARDECTAVAGHVLCVGAELSHSEELTIVGPHLVPDLSVPAARPQCSQPSQLSAAGRRVQIVGNSKGKLKEQSFPFTPHGHTMRAVICEVI
jgi:hypothetical protein